jgi:hypothetical protein
MFCWIIVRHLPKPHHSPSLTPPHQVVALHSTGAMECSTIHANVAVLYTSMLAANFAAFEKLHQATQICVLDLDMCG